MKNKSLVQSVSSNFNRVLTGALVLCLNSPFSSGQSPVLGNADNFAVFTQTGAFTNLGNSTITGDIGTNAGAFSGFPPGILFGTSHVADANSASASLDLETAYTYMSGLSCDSVIGPVLGSDQSLKPNNYCIGSAASLDGNLILDAGNDPDAIFIFKINGALNTSSFANITLINGASSCQIFWQINGLFSLGENAFFTGTLLINGAVSLLESSSLIGKVLSKAGAIDLHNNTVSFVCGPTILPIELVTFEAKCRENNAELKWIVSSETNLVFYTIERSSNGLDWSILAFSEVADHDDFEHAYHFIDSEPLKSLSYYRLTSNDNNGKTEQSSIIPFQSCLAKESSFDLYPNPGKGVFKIIYSDHNDALPLVSVYNISGELLYQQAYQLSGIDLSDYVNGLYFIHLTQGHSTSIKKITLTH